ncbi:hypothetical protein CBR_g18583 [Chara braunii]|uniref:AB hydrolase-1 domain-containing protein n=1 Tax=Chara braunii TaxID=69332 RepID=A0A388JT97_CHABU|nr:hypothetical protein CBR_g18583 [Chara braunii]|eukprot:GBG60987.1 hypothetical protein CBR_g18583 [Chara braunii]
MACLGTVFSLTGLIETRYANLCRSCGLESHLVALDDDTTMHCWAPRERFADDPRPALQAGDAPVAAEGGAGGLLGEGGERLRVHSQTLKTVATYKKKSKGGGFPLVLIHGFGATALFQWPEQVKELSSVFDLYVPDLLFFGKSTTRRPERSETFQAECLLKLLTKLSVGQFNIVGLSYGGFVAFRMAALEPDRVKKVVVTDCPGAVMTKDDYQELLKRCGVKNITDLLLPKRPKDLRRLLELAYHRPRWLPVCVLMDAYHALFTDMVDEKRELLQAVMTYLDDPPVKDLEGLSQQFLIVWGERDVVFPVELATRLAQSLGSTRARIAILEDSGHVPQLEHPKEYNQLLKNFLLAQE